MRLLERRSRADIERLLETASPGVREEIELGLYMEAFESDYERWLRTLFPEHMAAPFAEHHHDLWRWVWSIQENRPRPFVGAWARGGAKSTSAELASIAVGALEKRRYGLYVCGTQDQADDHVGENISSMLESPALAEHYPELTERRVSKYGHSRGWRRNRLWTAHGLVIDALGLDVAARGAKLEEARPDFIVFDDLDSEDDGPAQVDKKIRAITRKLLPAGSPNLAVLAIQNLIHPDSIFAQLVDGRADFLTGRIISGPIPAVRDLVTGERDGRITIVSGTPTWEGQNLDTCEEQINEWGLTAFLGEAQHDVEAPPGGMFDHIDFDTKTISRDDYDQLVTANEIIETTVWVDPAVTSTDRSDAHGIQCDSIGMDGTIYRLYSYEKRGTPLDTLKRAIAAGVEHGATTLGAETDQGGDTWQSVYREAIQELRSDGDITDDTVIPRFLSEKAGSTQQSKAHRAQQMLSDYERPGRIRHLEGTSSTVLVRALFRFPRTKPFDLVDAAFWSWRYLRPEGSRGTGASHGKVTSAATLPARGETMGLGRRR